MSDQADLLVDGTLVNVQTGRLEDRAIVVDNGRIVSLEAEPADKNVEVNFVAPGLIDAHVHVESSMVTLPRYGEAVVPRGVTGIIHDPHEIANVLGAEGVRTVVKDAGKTPLKARFGVPSSVPATSFQDNGATLDAATVRDLLEIEDVVALAEVMDIMGVVAEDKEVHAKITAAREASVTVDGHLPRVSGSVLQKAARYLETDHESISTEELLEKYRTGLRCYIREGSTTKNLEDLLPILEKVDSRHLSLCTDDRNTVDLVEEGGIDYVVKKAIDEGVDPVEAIQMATLNTAESYNLPTGRIEPGAPADLVLLDDLNNWEVDQVIVDGKLNPTQIDTTSDTTEIARDTVEFEMVNPDKLATKINEKGKNTHPIRVINVGELQTEMTESEVSSENGKLMADVDNDILPAAVIERHGKEAGIGTGFVQGFGLSQGAIASTIAHDAHNLVVVGTSHAAMAKVANHIKEIGGGMSVYNSEISEFTSLSLPVAGLMSDEPLESTKEDFQAVEDAAREIGLAHSGGIMELTFIALEVIPEVRLTNNGLVDVKSMEYIDVILSSDK